MKFYALRENCFMMAKMSYSTSKIVLKTHFHEKVPAFRLMDYN